MAIEKDRRITAGDLGEDVSMDEMMTNKALLQVVESGSSRPPRWSLAFQSQPSRDR